MIKSLIKLVFGDRRWKRHGSRAKIIVTIVVSWIVDAVCRTGITGIVLELSHISDTALGTICGNLHDKTRSGYNATSRSSTSTTVLDGSTPV